MSAGGKGYVDPQMFQVVQLLDQLNNILEGIVVELAGVDANIWQLYSKQAPSTRQLKGYSKLKRLRDKWIHRIKLVEEDPYYQLDEHADEKERALYTYTRGLRILEDYLKRGGEAFHPFRKGVRVITTPFAAGQPTADTTTMQQGRIAGIKTRIKTITEQIQKSIGLAKQDKEEEQQINVEAD